MRIALLVHGLPPERRTGVEVHALALARALARRGHAVECFAPKDAPARAHLAQERVVLEEGLAVTRLAVAAPAADERGRRIVPGAVEAFARFLDRERPDVLHVEHLLRVGPGAVRAARDRGVPVSVQAHDPLAVAPDHLLLRTDGAPLPLGADGRPTADALARNALARAALERALPAGDHGTVVLPELLGTALAAELAEVLDGVLEGDLVRRRDALAGELAAEAEEWREAFLAADLVCASSDGLAVALRAAGVRVDEVLPCGIDVEPLARLRARRGQRDGAPLRFGVLGGLRPHKGAHVALEALALLRSDGAPDVALALHGEGEGLERRALAARARELDATVGGAFAPEELPARLAELDVLLVPSIWPENAPFVVREAFAAGVPVVASDVGALAESLADGGGRLVPPNDPRALADAMRALVEDRDAFDALRASVPAPRTIEVEAVAWEKRLSALAVRASGERDRLRATLPAHLADFAARRDALDRAPLRELVAAAADGIDALRTRLAPRDARTPGERLASALEGGDGLREALGDARRAGAWAEERAEQRAREADALRAESAWRAERLGAAEEERAWTAERLAASERRAEAAESERDEARRGRDTEQARAAWLEQQAGHERERAGWLAERAEALEREAAWLAETRDADRTERDWLRATLDDRDAHLAEARGALADLSAALDALAAERDALADRAVAGDAAAEHAASLEREVAARDAHAAFLERGLTDLLAALGAESGRDADWPRALEAAREELDRCAAELGWRADEMDRAAAEARRRGVRWLRAGVLRRARGWTREDEA